MNVLYGYDVSSFKGTCLFVWLMGKCVHCCVLLKNNPYAKKGHETCFVSENLKHYKVFDVDDPVDTHE